jgi:peptide/nickel transport system substrate-binding protein
VRSQISTRGWYRVLALLLGLALVAAACGDDDTGGDDAAPDDTSGESSTTTEGVDPASITPGGEITFGTESDVASLMPGVAAQPADKVITLGIFDPLVSFNDDNEFVPFLAESVEPNEAADEWTVTLREGVTFHDDTPLNADAVVKHFEYLKDPANACPCLDQANQIASMETPDGPEGLTVVLTLGEPNVAFENFLAGSSGYIPSPTALASMGDDFQTSPVGTGPFMMERFVPGDRVVLVKNPNYWGTDEAGNQLPYLDRITFVPIPDAGQRLAALQAGDIDMFQTATSDVIVQAEEAGFNAQKISGSSSTVVLLNHSKPPFDDVKARTAIAKIINRDVMNERVYGGVRVPALSAFAPDSPYLNEDAGVPEFDMEGATALVEELGGLEFSLVCIPTPESEQLLQIVKQFGEQAGMSITLETQEQGAFVNRIFGKGGDYEAACFRTNHFVEPDQIRASLTTDDAGNLIFYSNPEVDALLEEGRSTADVEERQRIYGEIQEITGEDVTAIPLLYDLFGNVYTDEVGPPPPGEANSLGAIMPGYLYRTDQ